MNLTRVEQIAKAVLYEGYMLYPYRPSSVRTRRLVNSEMLYPEAYCDAQEGNDACSMRTECLVRGNRDSGIEGRVRFLRLQIRRRRDSVLPEGWQEAAEQVMSWPAFSLGKLCEDQMTHTFAFASEYDAEHEFSREAMEGVVEVSALELGDDLFKISLLVRNTTPMENASVSRDDALMHSLVSTHTVMGVTGAEFISLLEPPQGLAELAASCQNVGAWPVLVGEAGQKDTLLASPIILYDYPQIASESAGDLFDGTEIDEILSLRIMTLTDQEKQEMRQSDDRARQILERTEAMPAEQFMKLHGVVRGLRHSAEGTHE